MLDKFSFYFRHSFNDLRVNRRLTIFALMAIGAGVAAIVSLQTLAVMIGDTLEGNLQETNRGDISVALSGPDTPQNEDLIDQGVAEGVLVEDNTFSLVQDEALVRVSEDGLEAIQAWIDDSPFAGQVEMTYRVTVTSFVGLFTGTGTGTAVTSTATDDQATQLTPVMIDSDVYPFYSEVTAKDGTPLADLLQDPTDIVIGEDLADDLGLSIGDTVRINGSDADFTVRGVVETKMEVKNPITDLFAGLFGFYYLDVGAIDLFDDLKFQVESVYLRADDPAQTDAIAEAFANRFPYLETVTTSDMSEQNEAIVDQIADVVTIMGLVSLLIGSIGIVNTMQVIVRRRTLEVAVLKTVGLQGEQVTILFLTEALIMGVLGGLLGIVMGWGATFIIRGTAESIFATDIPFRPALTPALNGFVVGMLVTTVFGFLPTLAAGLVRPSIVLRPMDSVVPKAGRLRTLGALLLIVVVLSVIASGFLDSPVLAFAVVAGTFITAGIFFALLSLLIWVLGRFLPSFGIVDLKISLRQMLAGRSRGASTLLALVVGVFSLSIITLVVDSTLDLLNSLLQEQGNVLVTAQNTRTLEQVEETLGSLEGVNGFTTTLAYTSELVFFEDSETGNVYGPEEVRQLLRDTNWNFPPFFAGTDEEREDLQQQILDDTLLDTPIEARSLDNLTPVDMASGRNMTVEDSGLPVLVLTEDDIYEKIGVTVGDKVTYIISAPGGNDTQEITFEVIGIQKFSSVTVNFSGASSYAPIDTFPEEISPDEIAIIVDIVEDNIPELRRSLAGIPGTFALELSVFTELINSLVETFTAFPTMVAALGLIVGGVVIANSVALSTMERRREIAIMKSVGLQRERVLGMLLLENALLGLVGGLIGVGIGVLALIILASQTDAPISAISYETVLGLMLLCVGIALVAALSSAWGASGEKPLNVLRYE